MMTLKELRTVVGVPNKEKRVPSVKALTNAKIPVAVKEKLDEKTEITVFANGYVYYRIDNRATVFPFPEANSYCYDAVMGAGNIISAEFFENENWYMRLILEGEDRLKENQRIRQNVREISYSCVSEEWAALSTRDNQALDCLIEEETVRAILQQLDGRQRYAFIRYYIDCATQKEIAEEMSIGRSTLTELLSNTVEMVRKEMGVNRLNLEVHFKRNKKN